MRRKSRGKSRLRNCGGHGGWKNMKHIPPENGVFHGDFPWDRIREQKHHKNKQK